MPVILIAFIVMLSLAAFLPGPREDLDAERLLDGQVAAGQLRNWHAAAVRACWATGGLCTPGQTATGRIQDASVAAQLSRSTGAGTAYGAGRFASYFDGIYVFSFFTGAPSRTPATATADASAALLTTSSPDSLVSVGRWRSATGQFVSSSYIVLINQQQRLRQPLAIPTQPNAYAGNLPPEIPMIATLVRQVECPSGSCVD